MDSQDQRQEQQQPEQRSQNEHRLITEAEAPLWDFSEFRRISIPAFPCSSSSVATVTSLATATSSHTSPPPRQYEQTQESTVFEFSTQSVADPSKPAILFCHGLGSNRTIWRESALFLSQEGFAVGYCDLVGHGDSTDTAAEGASLTAGNALPHRGIRSGNISKFSISLFCEQLQQLLLFLRQHLMTAAEDESKCGTKHEEPNEVGESGPRSIMISTADSSELVHLLPFSWNQKVIIVGHSYGCAVSMEVAIRFPELVSSVVCVDGGYINLQKMYPDFASCIMKLCPPPFVHLSYAALEGIIRTEWCRGWSELGIQSMLNNFRAVSDCSHGRQLQQVEPKLIPPIHVQLLQNFWNYNPIERATLVMQPMLLLPSAERSTPFTANKQSDIDELLNARNDGTDSRSRCIMLNECLRHDIPATHPKLLMERIVESIENGFLK